MAGAQFRSNSIVLLLAGERGEGQLLELSDVFIRGAAAAADDIDKSLFDEGAHVRGHELRCLIVLAHLIRKARIRIGAYINMFARAGVVGICDAAQFAQMRQHILSAERAVEADAEQRRMGDRDEECFERLSAEQASRTVADGGAEHQGNAAPCSIHGAVGGIEGSLRVERVEDRLDEQGVHATLDEGCHLLRVGTDEFVEGEGAQGGVADVGAYRQRFVCRTYGTHDERPCPRCAPVGVGNCLCTAFAGDAHGGEIDVAHEVFAAVVGERDALGVEGVGGDDVGTRLQVAPMDVGDDVGAGEAQQIVVACLLPG